MLEELKIWLKKQLEEHQMENLPKGITFTINRVAIRSYKNVLDKIEELEKQKKD